LNSLKGQRGIARVFNARAFPSTEASRQTAPFASCTPMLSQGSSLLKQTTTTRRSLSTYEGSNGQGLRAYPQYAVVGENFMAVKVMPPTFKLSKNSVLAMDASQKGRILLEFAPRGADRKFLWEDLIRFGLSAEEVGLLVNQLPHYKVEFSRLSSARGNDGEKPYGTAMSSDTPDKVLIVEPGELGAINFTIDFVKDGVGGQPSGPGQDGNVGPIAVQVQAGEFEVIASLMRYSIPHLTGWAQQVDIAMHNAISETVNGRGGGGYSGGPSAGGGGGVPF